MSFETGWCEDCGTPIGVGPCAGCVAYASVSADVDDWPDDEECDYDSELE